MDEDERLAFHMRKAKETVHLVVVDHGPKEARRHEAIHRDLAQKRGLTVVYDPKKGKGD